ncbi:alpha/beta fold hydrolase [Enterococcus olivae]
MPKFNYDGIDFHYEDDKNNGLPFIFLHGLGGDVNQTLDILNDIPNIRRIAIDFRGHGKTIEFGDEKKLNFNQFADDIKAFVDYLELNSFIIGGISTGAGVALNFTIRYPKGIVKLVLSKPAWDDKPQPVVIQTAFKTIYMIMNDDSIEDKKEAFKQTEIFNELNDISHYAGSTLLGQFDYPYAKSASLKLIKIPSDCPSNNKDDWANVKIPTLILGSELDPLHPMDFAKLLYEAMPCSDFKEITSKTISGTKHKVDSVNAISEFITKD